MYTYKQTQPIALSSLFQFSIQGKAFPRSPRHFKGVLFEPLLPFPASLDCKLRRTEIGPLSRAISQLCVLVCVLCTVYCVYLCVYCVLRVLVNLCTCEHSPLSSNLSTRRETHFFFGKLNSPRLPFEPAAAKPLKWGGIESSNLFVSKRKEPKRVTIYLKFNFAHPLQEESPVFRLLC